MSVRVLKIIILTQILLSIVLIATQGIWAQETLSRKPSQSPLQNMAKPGQSDPDLAIEIAHKLANYRPFSYGSNSEHINLAKTDRFALMDIMMHRTSTDWRQPLDEYKQKYKEYGTANNSLIEVFEAALAAQKIPNTDYKKSTPYQNLKRLSHSDDWFVANRAHIVLSVESILRGYPKQAIEHAQLAVTLIPIEGDKTMFDEARYETSDLLHTIFTQEVNIPETIRFTGQLVDLGIAANRELDKNGILHNVADVFYEMGDFKTANEIAQIMIQIKDADKPLSQVWANYNLGRSYLGLKQYENASMALEAVLELKSPQAVEISSLSFLSYAYARQNKPTDSQIMIAKAHALIENSPYYTHDKVLYLSKAEAVNYSNSGQHKKAMIAMSHWAQGEVDKKSRALSKSRIDASNRLAATQLLKNEKIERLEESNALNRKVIQRTYAVAALLFTLLIISLIGLALTLKNKRKVTALNKTLRATNAELEIAIEGSKVADKAKAQFLAVMSHELRTPLNGLIAMSDLMGDMNLDEQMQTCVKVISESSDRLFALVKNILIAAEIDNHKFEYDTTNNLHTECTRLIAKHRPKAQEKSLVLHARGTKSLNRVYAYNKTVLDIVFLNLLSNAIEYTESGSVSIHIGVKTRMDGTKFFSISVIDTGIGMEEELVRKCQDLFFQNDSSITRAHDGAGLGLHVVGKIMNILGGKLTISSEINVGTEIHAVFPIELAETQSLPLDLAPAA